LLLGGLFFFSVFFFLWVWLCLLGVLWGAAGGGGPPRRPPPPATGHMHHVPPRFGFRRQIEYIFLGPAPVALGNEV
jgi:hypothetical protein